MPQGDAAGVLVRVDAATREEVQRRRSAETGHRRRLSQGDGRAIDVVLGTAGDIALDCTGRALFLIDVERRQVLCATKDDRAIEWRRILLDTVLVTAGLALGGEALHAGAVEIADRVVVIAAGTGGGKSTLCAELIRRGARLVTDDVLFLEARAAGPLAHPGPPLMNLPNGDSRAPDGLGTVLGVLGGEVWLSVERWAGAARPVGAVVHLERRSAAAGPELTRMESPRDLLGLALDSGPGAERVRGRFEMVAAVSDRAWRLVAGLDTPPDALAAAVESLAAASTVR